MRPTQRHLFFAVALLFCSGIALAQTSSTAQPVNPDPLHFKDFIDWWNSVFNNDPPPQPPPQPKLQPNQSYKIQKECIGNQFYNVRYLVTKSQGTTFTQFIDKTPLGEECGASTDERGNPNPNADPKDSVLYKIRHSGDPKPFSLPPGFSLPGPNGSATPLSAGNVAEKDPAAAVPAPAPTAFRLTLPYRPMPFEPLYTAADSPTPTGTTCISQGNPSAFDVNHLSGSVTRSNLCTDQVITAISVTPHPLQVQVTPDGSLAVVTSFDGAVTFIDTTTNQVVKILQAPGGFFPSGLAISPDGVYALITSFDDANPALAVINMSTKTIVSTVNLSTTFPQSVFLNPDASEAWVTYPFNNLVEVLDLMTLTVNTRLTIGRPFAVAFNPTGTVAYVSSGSNGSTGTVQVLDTRTYAVLKSIPAGFGAAELLVSPDERSVSVNNFLSGTVTIFDPTNYANTTFSVPGSPRGSVFVPVQ